MARVLVVGWELPERSPNAKLEAANYRTWQLVEPLRREGHQIHLAAGRIGADFPAEPLGTESADSIAYTPIRFSQPFWMRELQRLHDAFRPDCVVGVTFLGALRASRLRTTAPMWFDIYGDQLAEMQAKAFRTQSDRGIATQIEFQHQILTAGDAFSACSGAQRHALIGQLSMVGRLNAATFGFEFAHVIPPGAGQPAEIVQPANIRGQIIPLEDRVVLWCGGYNTWTDVGTLYQGLEIAMGQDPRLHFVSVGGALPGCTSYECFTEMVSGSSFEARYHLLGWQPVSAVPGYYAEADFGISLDAACYEAELGTRTRLVEMMVYGLPLVTTLACELSYTIRDQGLGLAFPIGDARAMGESILRLAQDDRQRNQMAERSRVYATTTLSLENSTAPLRRWVRSPLRAPDRDPRRANLIPAWQHRTRSWVRQRLWSLAGLDQ
jgi:glycosyltransferase involved in cell wall biosynthesis